MIEKQIKPLVTTTNLCCELVPVCCSLIPLSVMSVPTLPGTPTVHHADLVPKNAPPEQYLATQICPKLSYQKLLLQYHAGTTTKSSIISYYSYHPSLTFSVSMSSKISLQEHSPLQPEAGCRWKRRHFLLMGEQENGLFLQVGFAGQQPVLAPWLCSDTQKARPLEQVLAVQPQASLREFITPFEEATSHW